MGQNFSTVLLLFIAIVAAKVDLKKLPFVFACVSLKYSIFNMVSCSETLNGDKHAKKKWKSQSRHFFTPLYVKVHYLIHIADIYSLDFLQPYSQNRRKNYVPAN